MLGVFLGRADSLSGDETTAWAEGIRRCQRDDGWFEDDDIADRNLRPGYARDRALLHRTRHAVLALQGLESSPMHPLAFAEQWLGAGAIRRWCETLDLSNYWYASNMMMDAALFLMKHPQRDAARCAVHDLLDFCDEHINPATGYHDAGRSDVRNAMAGAMHLYPVYILMQREIRCVPQIVETTIGLQQPDGLFGYESGAGGEDCLDYDAVLILSNTYFLCDDARNKRRIEQAFERCFEGILINRNPDGGFAYSRLLAIAMMGNILYPESRELWRMKNHLMEIWDATGCRTP
jgi:hypothetical protein